MANSFEGLIPFLKKERRLNHLISILNYDVQTVCPKNGIEEESNLISFYASEAASIKKDPEFLEALAKAKIDSSLNERQKAVVHNLSLEADFMAKVDMEEYSKWNEALQKSNEIWRLAKEHDDFASYLPYWEKAIEAARQIADRRKPNPGCSTYDSCLNMYEEGNDVKTLDAIFANLKDYLISRLPEVMEKQKEKVKGKVPYINADKQRHFARDLLDLIGFDLDSGALSESMHPFTAYFSPSDSRITTEIDENDYRGNLFSVIHEGGHAIEFQNLGKPQHEDYSAMLCSAAICETHSRFYENILGRSDAFAYPLQKLCQKHFGSPFYFMKHDQFVASLNEVKPNLIRCDADEFTYCLHIIIRYEVEKGIMNGTLSAKDAPLLWNKKYKEYLGLDVPSDKVGILQDVHWSDGSFGYFPSYALGNLYGAIIYERMKEELDIDGLLRTGNLIPIREWFAKNDFAYNYLPAKLWLNKVTGKEVSAEQFIAYLERKYS